MTTELQRLAAVLAGVEAMPHLAAELVSPQAIGADEWGTARTTPECIVQDYLYSDVGLLVAPGGVGKTTLTLFEAAHIAIGRPLYGLAIIKPGPVVFVTGEDSRELLVARLREVVKAMKLDNATTELVRQKTFIIDVSGSGFRLTEVVGQCIRPSAGVDQLIEACRAIQPVMIIIDPAISFGVGEARVNDAEQGLIDAARRIRKALNCCVRFVHHSGKQNARERITDQYAGRGGSAFADGSRMVHVLQTLVGSEWFDATGQELRDGETGLRLVRAKMSFCAPRTDIFIRRSEYSFECVQPRAMTKRQKLEDAARRVWGALREEVDAGHYPSRNTLEHLELGLTRAELRAAVSLLLADGKIEERDVPTQGKGGRRKYLHPVVFGSPTASANQTEGEDSFANDESHFWFAAAIGKSLAANQTPPKDSLSFGSPRTNGEPMANLANQNMTEGWL